MICVGKDCKKTYLKNDESQNETKVQYHLTGTIFQLVSKWSFG